MLILFLRFLFLSNLSYKQELEGRWGCALLSHIGLCCHCHQEVWLTSNRKSCMRSLDFTRLDGPVLKKLPSTGPNTQHLMQMHLTGYDVTTSLVWSVSTYSVLRLVHSIFRAALLVLLGKRWAQSYLSSVLYVREKPYLQQPITNKSHINLICNSLKQINHTITSVYVVMYLCGSVNVNLGQ